MNRNERDRPKKLWTPKKQSRVCSIHFVDGQPTQSNPYPVLNLGYDAEKKINTIIGVRRKLHYVSGDTSQCR